MVEKEDLGSPPPGRPDQARHGKRDRESSGSTGNSTPKMSRIENTPIDGTKKKSLAEKDSHEESFETRLRKADLVSDGASSVVDEGSGCQSRKELVQLSL